MYLGSVKNDLDKDAVTAVNEIAKAFTFDHIETSEVQSLLTFSGCSLNLDVKLKNTAVNVRMNGNRNKLDSLLQGVLQVVREVKTDPVKWQHLNSMNNKLFASTDQGRFELRVNRFVQ